jgi:surfeit locus 1 family protein
VFILSQCQRIATMVEGMSRRSLWILLITVMGVGVTVSLGMWQLRRADSKQQVHDTRMERQHLPPLRNANLACHAEGWLQQEQRQAVLTGKWLHEQTVVLDNRPMSGRAGFLVLTPLQLSPSPRAVSCSNSGMAVLVQRGWLPRDANDRARIPAISKPQGWVSVPVRLTFAPSKMLALQADGLIERGMLRQNIDLVALSAEWHLPLMPGSAQQLADETGGTSVDKTEVRMLRQWWQPEADVSKHHGYAAQWFLMAITMMGLYGWFQWWRPWRQAQE